LEPKLMADKMRATARQTTNCEMSSVMGTSTRCRSDF
jgi:hypothetical protein